LFALLVLTMIYTLYKARMQKWKYWINFRWPSRKKSPP
jgi:hypothetical protein